MDKRNLYKKLGSQLIEKGQWFLKEAFNVRVERVATKVHIRNLFTSLGFNNSKILFADAKHSVVSLDTMKDIIKYSWVDRKKYLDEVHDCDDYALEFKAHSSEIYNINSVALSKHMKVTTNTGKEIWHRACVFLAIEDNILKAYLLETQNDGFVEIKKGILPVIGSWKYQLDTIEF